MFFINSEELLEKSVQSLSLDVVNLNNSHISFIFPVPFIVGLLFKLFFFFFPSGVPEEEGLGQVLMLTLWVWSPLHIHNRWQADL